MAVTLNQSKTSPVPERSRRVAVVLPHLGLGGAQRVATAMSAYWFDRGHDVTIVTLLDQPSDFYRLHPQVKRITLPNGVLIRARRFIVRKIEGTKASTSIGAPGRGNTAAGGNRKLDRLRAMYRALLRIEARMLGFAARKRLTGTIESRLHGAPAYLLLAGTKASRRLRADHSGRRLQPAGCDQHHHRRRVGRSSPPYHHL